MLPKNNKAEATGFIAILFFFMLSLAVLLAFFLRLRQFSHRILHDNLFRSVFVLGLS